MSKLHPDRASTRTQWDDLNPEHLAHLARLARDEDLAGWGFRSTPNHPGDPTSELLLPTQFAQTPATARIRSRQPLVPCGLRLIPLLLQAYDPELKFVPAPGIDDGTPCKEPTTLGTLQGPAASLLTAERVVLNFVQHLSGVATRTASHVAALGNSHTRLLDTRKTHPVYRALEKYAVSMGGGYNHRLGLYDRFMIKDNHVALLQNNYGGNWSQHLAQQKALRPGLLLEVEVDHPDQIPPLLETNAVDVLLLDNFSAHTARSAIQSIAGQCLVEISGNVSLKSLPELGSLGADFISCGGLTHQSTWLDIGLDSGE